MKPLKDRISKIHGRNQSKDQNKKKLKSRTLNESSRISKISRKSSKARSIYDSESPVKDSDRKSLSNKRKNTGLLLIDIKTTTNLIESTLNKSYSFRRKQSSKSQNPHSRLIRDIYSKSKRARSKPSNDPHQANYMSSNFEKRGSSDGNLIFRTMDPDFKKNRESEDEMIKMQDFSLVIPENISSLLHDESDSKGYFVKNSEIKHHIEKSRTFRFHKTLGSQSQASSEMEKRSSKKILEMKFLEGKKSKKSKIFEKPRRTNSPNSKKKFKTLGSFGSSKFQASSPSLYKRPTSTRSKRKMSQTGDLNVTSFIRNMAKKSYLLEGNVKRQYESPKKKSKRKRYPSNPSIFGAKYSSSNLYKTGNSSKYFTSKYSSARGNSVSSQRNYNFPSMDKCSKGVFLKKKKPMKRNIDIEKIDRLLRGKKTNKKSKSTTRRYTSRSRDKAISPQLCLRYKEDEAQNPTNENIDLPRTAVDSNELPEDTPCPMPEKVSEDIHNLEIFFDKCEMKKLFTSRPEIIFQGKKTLPTDNSGKKDVRTIIPRENTSPGENRPSEESELGYNSRRMNSLKTSEDIDSGGAIPPNSLVSSKDYKKNGGKDRTGFNQVFNFSTIAQGGYYINNYDSKKEEDEKGSKRSSKFARSNASPGQIYQPKNSLGSQFERGEYPFIKSSRFYLERDTLNKKNTSFNRHAMETSNNPVNFSSKFNSKDRSYSVADDENSPKKLITFDTSEDSGEFIRLSEVIFGEDKLSVMAKIEEMRAEEVKRSRMRVNKMFGGFEQRKLKVANGIENVSSIYNINSPKNALENFNNHSKNYSKMMEEKMKKQIDRQISSSKKFKEYQEDMSKDAIDDDEDTVNVYIKEEKNFTAGKTSSYIETSVKSMTNSSKDSLSSREKSTFNHPNDYIMTSPTVPHQSTITSSQNVNYSTEETTSNPTVSLTFRTGTTDVNLDATNRTSLGPKNLMMLDLPEFLYDSTEDGAKQLFSSRVKEQSHIDFLDKNLSEEKDQSTMRQITEERSSVITDDFRTNTDFEVEEEGFGVNLLEKFEHEDFLLEKENRMRNTEQKDDKIFENYNIQLSASPSKEDEDQTYQKMVIQKDIQEKINTIGQLPEVRMDIQRRPRTPQSQSTINSDLLNKLPNPNRPSLNLGEDLSIATENKGLLEKNKMKIGISSCKNSSKKKIKFGASSFQLGNSVDVNAFQKAKKEDEDIATFVKKKATIIKKKMNIEVATSKDTLIEEPLEDTPKFGLLPENSNLMLFKTTGIKQQVIKKSQFTPSSRFDETEEDVCSDFCWSDEDKRRKRELQNNLLGKELYHMQLDKGQAPGILTYTSSNATFQAKSSRKNFESIDSWKEKNDRAKIPLTYQIFPFIPQRRPLLIEDRVFIFENNVKRKVYGSPKKIMKFKRSKRYREREDIPSMTCQKLIVVKTNNKWSISPLKKKGGVNQGFIKIEEVRSSLEVDNSDPEIQKDGRVRDFNFSSNTSAINFISNLTNYKIERTITDESKSTLRDINNASFGNTSNSNNYLSPEVILSPDQVTSTDFKRKSIANGIEKNRKISEFSVLPNPPIIATTPFKKDESVPVPHHVNSSVTESQVIKHRETYDFDDKTEYVELSYRRDGQLTENSSIIGNSSNFKSEKFDQICEDKFFRERQVSAKKLIDQRRRTVAESSPDLKNVVSKVSVRNGENIDVLPQMQRVKRVKTSSDLHQNISLIPEKKKKKSKSKKKKRLRKKNSKKKIKDIFGERSRNKPKRSKTNVSKEKIVNSLKLRKQKKSKVRSTKNIPKSKIISKQPILTPSRHQHQENPRGTSANLSPFGPAVHLSKDSTWPDHLPDAARGAYHSEDKDSPRHHLASAGYKHPEEQGSIPFKKLRDGPFLER